MDPMSQSEYAAFELATTNDTIVERNGFWWRRIRKGFFRPLCPFLPENHVLSCHSKPLGFVQYGLMDSSKCNSCLNLIMFNRPDQYELDALSRDVRRNIRRSQEKNIKIEQITDPELMITQSESVYQNFIQRTGYVFDKRRLDSDYYRRWINVLFSFPKATIHGAFHDRCLISIIIEVIVEDVFIIKAMINAKDALKLHAPDLQLHHARLRAKAQHHVHSIFNGYLTPIPGLNQFKILRGAEVWCLPARIEVPAPLLKFVQLVRPAQYRFLMGLK